MGTLGMEEKIESSYFGPDYDPKKIPKKMQGAIRDYKFKRSHEDKFEVSNHMQIRTMAPFNIRCNGCGNYTNKGTKLQANVDQMPGDKPGEQFMMYWGGLA